MLSELVTHTVPGRSFTSNIATLAIAVSRGYSIINYQEGGQHGKT